MSKSQPPNKLSKREAVTKVNALLDEIQYPTSTELILRQKLRSHFHALGSSSTSQSFDDEAEETPHDIVVKYHSGWTQRVRTYAGNRFLEAKNASKLLAPSSITSSASSTTLLSGEVENPLMSKQFIMDAFYKQQQKQQQNNNNTCENNEHDSSNNATSNSFHISTPGLSPVRHEAAHHMSRHQDVGTEQRNDEDRGQQERSEEKQSKEKISKETTRSPPEKEKEEEVIEEKGEGGLKKESPPRPASEVFNEFHQLELASQHYHLQLAYLADVQSVMEKSPGYRAAMHQRSEADLQRITALELKVFPTTAECRDLSKSVLFKQLQRIQEHQLAQLDAINDLQAKRRRNNLTNSAAMLSVPQQQKTTTKAKPQQTTNDNKQNETNVVVVDKEDGIPDEEEEEASGFSSFFFSVKNGGEEKVKLTTPISSIAEEEKTPKKKPEEEMKSERERSQSITVERRRQSSVTTPPSRTVSFRHNEEAEVKISRRKSSFCISSAIEIGEMGVEEEKKVQNPEEGKLLTGSRKPSNAADQQGPQIEPASSLLLNKRESIVTSDFFMKKNISTSSSSRDVYISREQLFSEGQQLIQAILGDSKDDENGEGKKDDDDDDDVCEKEESSLLNEDDEGVEDDLMMMHKNNKLQEEVLAIRFESSVAKEDEIDRCLKTALAFRSCGTVDAFLTLAKKVRREARERRTAEKLKELLGDTTGEDKKARSLLRMQHNRGRRAEIRKKYSNIHSGRDDYGDRWQGRNGKKSSETAAAEISALLMEAESSSSSNDDDDDDDDSEGGPGGYSSSSRARRHHETKEDALKRRLLRTSVRFTNIEHVPIIQLLKKRNEEQLLLTEDERRRRVHQLQKISRRDRGHHGSATAMMANDDSLFGGASGGVNFYQQRHNLQFKHKKLIEELQEMDNSFLSREISENVDEATQHRQEVLLSNVHQVGLSSSSSSNTRSSQQNRGGLLSNNNNTGQKMKKGGMDSGDNVEITFGGRKHTSVRIQIHNDGDGIQTAGRGGSLRGQTGGGSSLLDPEGGGNRHPVLTGAMLRLGVQKYTDRKLSSDPTGDIPSLVGSILNEEHQSMSSSISEEKLNTAAENGPLKKKKKGGLKANVDVPVGAKLAINGKEFVFSEMFRQTKDD